LDKKAELIWEGQRARIILEYQFSELHPELADFNFRYDDYDSSIEIDNVPPDFRLSKDSWKMLMDEGFRICFVNHTDGWETHYNRNNSTGWRKGLNK
jgi:hypothetical protein